MPAHRRPAMILRAMPGLSTRVSSRLLFLFSLSAFASLRCLHAPPASLCLPSSLLSPLAATPSPASCAAADSRPGAFVPSASAPQFFALALPVSSEETDVSEDRDDDDFRDEDGVGDDDAIRDDEIEEREEDLLLMQKAATAAGQSAQAKLAGGSEARNQSPGEVRGPGDSADPRLDRLLQLRREATDALQTRIGKVLENFEKVSFTDPGQIDGILFRETFQDDPLARGRWVPSADPKFQGRWAVETRSEAVIAGEKNLGMQDMNKFHGVATRLSSPVTDTLNSHFVFQYEILQTRPLTCGGGYVKLLDFPKDKALKDFNHLTDYVIMFGPDMCGSSNVVNFILKILNPATGGWTEHRLDAPPRLTPSPLSNLLTLWIKPDDTFEIHVDGSVVRQGSLWKDMLPPLQPPKTLVVGLRASAAEDEDAHAGDEAKKNSTSGIRNPAYFKLEHAHRLRNINAIGLELWTVEGGTAFDNVILANSIEAARTFAKTTFDVRRRKEQELRLQMDTVHRAWRLEFAEKQRALEAELESEKASSLPSSFLDGLLVTLQQFADATGLFSPFVLAALAACTLCLLLVIGRQRPRPSSPREPTEKEGKKKK
ncbi:Calr protein, related [Neospora caninum Liverpool]|uniref:Calr protein, related n=1 Tax=Neospora caninum (strain Liverpool) TaxID=572307 RepID=F0VMR8_NEOCL|nr:Calr protein, related [Neospora caninum Liverpool]CBZ55014.1 Calr protein, related [Neospora caninum Liverpool]CEL69739.1 TPA: Calr protein, related [Neospora caninum Liverpool]|eukprot:XP_003885042.1 Calr protein, related [Neospora caninum Liverpool]